MADFCIYTIGEGEDGVMLGLYMDVHDRCLTREACISERISEQKLQDERPWHGQIIAGHGN